MKQIIIFFSLAISLIACGQNSSSDNATVTTVIALNQEDLANEISKENVVLIDVRTPEEVAEGYIQGADLFMNINDDAFQEEINKLDKNQSYVMYCRSGARSGRASEYMIANGFTQVYNLTGGIMGYTGTIVK